MASPNNPNGDPEVDAKKSDIINNAKKARKDLR
jgi:hypothetical protein